MTALASAAPAASAALWSDDVFDDDDDAARTAKRERPLDHPPTSSSFSDAHARDHSDGGRGSDMDIDAEEDEDLLDRLEMERVAELEATAVLLDPPSAAAFVHPRLVPIADVKLQAHHLLATDTAPSPPVLHSTFPTIEAFRLAALCVALPHRLSAQVWFRISLPDQPQTLALRCPKYGTAHRCRWFVKAVERTPGGVVDVVDGTWDHSHPLSTAATSSTDTAPPSPSPGSSASASSPAASSSPDTVPSPHQTPLPTLATKPAAGSAKRTLPPDQGIDSLPALKRRKRTHKPAPAPAPAPAPVPVQATGNSLADWGLVTPPYDGDWDGLASTSPRELATAIPLETRHATPATLLAHLVARSSLPPGILRVTWSRPPAFHFGCTAPGPSCGFVVKAVPCPPERSRGLGGWEIREATWAHGTACPVRWVAPAKETLDTTTVPKSRLPTQSYPSPAWSTAPSVAPLPPIRPSRLPSHSHGALPPSSTAPRPPSSPSTAPSFAVALPALLASLAPKSRLASFAPALIAHGVDTPDRLVLLLAVLERGDAETETWLETTVGLGRLEVVFLVKGVRGVLTPW